MKFSDLISCFRNSTDIFDMSFLIYTLIHRRGKEKMFQDEEIAQKDRVHVPRMWKL